MQMTCCFQLPRSTLCASRSTAVLFSLMSTMFYSIPRNVHCIRFQIASLPVFQFPVSLQGVQLSWTSSILYLRHIITSFCKDADDINARLNSFCSQSNHFLACFGHISLSVKIRHFLNFCDSFMVAWMGPESQRLHYFWSNMA